MTSQMSSTETKIRGRGRLHLKPIPGSVDKTTYVIDIELQHDPARLSIADLRRSAEQMVKESKFEHAYRLWTAVGTAADRANRSSLSALARAQADGAQHRAKFLAAAEDRRTSVPTGADRVSTKYNYDELAADVAEGMTKTAAARKYGCSPSTIQRAVDYVTQRDDLLEESPEVLDQLMAGVDLETVARRYDVSPKVLRWMVNSDFNRRS